MCLRNLLCSIGLKMFYLQITSCLTNNRDDIRDQVEGGQRQEGMAQGTIVPSLEKEKGKCGPGNGEPRSSLRAGAGIYAEHAGRPRMPATSVRCASSSFFTSSETPALSPAI